MISFQVKYFIRLLEKIKEMLFSFLSTRGCSTPFKHKEDLLRLVHSRENAIAVPELTKAK